MRISNGNYIQNVDDAKSNTEPQSVADIFPTVGRCTSVYSKRNRGWQLLGKLTNTAGRKAMKV